MKLVLVLGDQLSEGLASLRAADKGHDIVVMAEVLEEGRYVPHHPKKIALVLAAMRKFARHLRDAGWTVSYTKLDDPLNTQTIPGELIRYSQTHGTTQVLATEPGEWRLIQSLTKVPLDVTLMEDDRFIATHAEFQAWAKGRKSLRMEYFYRDMRRKTGLLMEDGAPMGGQWNFDHDNRKRPPADLQPYPPKQFAPDEIVEDVLDLVDRTFKAHFGSLKPFSFATDRAQARAQLDQFINYALPNFGDYQDAMLRSEPFLYHALVSTSLNIGLLDPLEICKAVETSYLERDDIPLNAAEGFIRQVIGWREYVRGIYFLEGPGYTTRNSLQHQRPLPDFYWSGDTKMRCMQECIRQTEDHAYAHHIQRLMVTGNFALLAGIVPDAVHQWYLSVYADAFEWVEAPNTIGMSQFADGGVFASKPYVSSGAYINKMSDYCKSCAYSVTAKTGDAACPFNLLYWHFLLRHEATFSQNPRMANMYRTLYRMDASRRETVLEDANALLSRLDQGELI